MNKRMAVLRATSAGVGLLALVQGCAKVAVEPIEVKPIHITMDVNIRVQRELDQFFAFEDKLMTGGGGPTTAPVQPRSDARD